MAYVGSSNVRDNFGRFQKYATIRIKKHLRKTAEELKVNIQEEVADKLKEVYIDNILTSYGSRGGMGSYTHTDTFLENIDTKIENDKVKIVLNKNVKYDGGKTLGKVYEYLVEGTQGTGFYNFKNEEGEWKTAYNYPTPAHLFEQHTQLQMKGFLESLNVKQFVKPRRYKKK